MDFDLSEDQKKLQTAVAEFADNEVAPTAEARDREAAFPSELYLALGRLGITAIAFPEEVGGMGLGALEMALAVEQLARADQSLAVSAMVSVATGLTLLRFGSDEQTRVYLPDVVAGRKVCAIAGTEAEAGSDTAGFKTRAELADGKWRLNGSKAYITNPGTELTSFTLVLALAGARDDGGRAFTIFLVPAGTKGFVAGEPYNKMGWRSSDTRPLYFEDCELGPEHVVGEVGRGRYTLHQGYQQARVFLAACSLGLAQGCLEHSVAYAKERQAFGATIGRFQLVQQMVAEMATQVEAARLLVYKAAWLADQGRASLKDLSIAKLFACEIGTKCADLAVQVHGGWGFMDDCPVSRHYRDNRVCTIGDGSSQIQTLLIARELGLDVQFQAPGPAP